MSSPARDSLLPFLLGVLDRSYGARAWHGPNLRGSLRGLTAEYATKRPAPGRRSIAELVLHVAYWKYTVRRRIRGDRKGSFATGGNNWFHVPDDLDARGWRDILRMLDEEHRSLRATVEDIDPRRLSRPAGKDVSLAELVQEVGAHDVYHAGQVQLIKRLVGVPARPRKGTAGDSSNGKSGKSPRA